MSEDERTTLARIIERQNTELATLKAEKERAEADNAVLWKIAKAGDELAQYASYAELVGGVSHNRTEIRKWCDEVFARSKGIDLDAPNPGSRIQARLAAGEKLAESALAIKKDLESDRGELTCREWWGETPRVLLEAVKALAKWEAAK